MNSYWKKLVFATKMTSNFHQETLFVFLLLSVVLLFLKYLLNKKYIFNYVSPYKQVFNKSRKIEKYRRDLRKFYFFKYTTGEVKRIST